MKKQIVAFLLLTLLALVGEGCKPQPPPMETDPDVSFTLKTTLIDGRMVFLGIGGEIDGVDNPNLLAQPGDRIRVTLVNEDGMPHDFALPDLNAQTALITAKGQTTDVDFIPSDTGEFTYFCTVPGHRQAGMEGKLIVYDP
jgi:nitrite reductase (NO-forming)